MWSERTDRRSHGCGIGRPMPGDLIPEWAKQDRSNRRNTGKDPSRPTDDGGQ